MFMTEFTPDNDSLVADRRLVRSLLKGEQSAFEVFADSYIPRVHRFVLRRLGGDAELSVEIAQTTLAKAIEKLDSWRGEALLMTWLCACARNEIAAHFRRAASRPREVEWSEIEHEGGASQPASPEKNALRAETRRLVHDALDGLPDHQAAALEAKYLEGLSVREIAARLKVSEKAAESLLTRARIKFKTAYEALQAKPAWTAGSIGRD